MIKSAAQNFGNAKRGHALYPRNRGPLANIEKGPWYQAASRLCLESKPAPYTLESMICSGVIDFGISALIESQVLQDLLTCIAAGIRFAIRNYLILKTSNRFHLGQLTGNNLTCLGWLLARMYAPDVLPWPFQSPRFYSLMRRGIE